MEKLAFASDYQEGAHPKIIDKLIRTNDLKTAGYGSDPYTQKAAELIRKACGNDDLDVFFLVGGTQTNKVVIDSLLRPYEGVISPDSGHINVHEAGAIENGGHKVLTIGNQNGKIDALAIRRYCDDFYHDGNSDHMVRPGMVYLSQPTEFGTLYSKDELIAIREVCDHYGLALYIDGARLAYALACKENDVSLKDLAKLCDAFYIGGTKCGSLFGEALVVKSGRIPHLFTLIKQRGALLAKGRILGVQFLAFFEDGLYLDIAGSAIIYADKIRAALKSKGYKIVFDNPTNQIFVEVDDRKMKELERNISFSFWEKVDASRTIIRLVTSWSTTEESVDQLIAML